ncbi:MAG: hypothetical protein M3O34_04500 [Chloroflexota bacterium]|nr:hypothetical protein [Chloroflexota bacterium]
MSQIDRDLQEALQRAQADDLGRIRPRHYREPEPVTPTNWGPLSFLQPATPWHLLGIGVLLFIVGRLLGRAALAGPLELLGVVLIMVSVLSLIVLRPPMVKRWRGRLIEMESSWRTRLYRRIYRR